MIVLYQICFSRQKKAAPKTIETNGINRITNRIFGRKKERRPQAKT
jgi:hypothetical protein